MQAPLHGEHYWVHGTGDHRGQAAQSLRCQSPKGGMFCVGMPLRHGVQRLMGTADDTPRRVGTVVCTSRPSQSCSEPVVAEVVGGGVSPVAVPVLDQPPLRVGMQVALVDHQQHLALGHAQLVGAAR